MSQLLIRYSLKIWINNDSLEMSYTNWKLTSMVLVTITGINDRMFRYWNRAEADATTAWNYILLRKYGKYEYDREHELTNIERMIY